MTILVAEDDSALRENVALALRKDGFTVVTARDGFQLASLIQVSLLSVSATWRPGLIVADVDMPGPDGLSTLARLRRIDRSTPAIVCTARTDRAFRVRTAELRVDEVLLKPFEIATLRRVVASILGTH